MKVLLINGSPNQNGCTFTALSEVANVLNKRGVETEILWIGKKAIHDCVGCGGCSKLGKCVFGDDDVNSIIERLDEIDGVVIGSPVYFAGPTGQMTSFLDRLFYAGGSKWNNKLGAAVVSCRRAGNTATFDRLNKYFTISNVHVVASQYWNLVHGFTPEDVRNDLEGMQTMRTLGENFAWLLKCIEAGRKAGVNEPEREEHVFTNFMR